MREDAIVYFHNTHPSPQGYDADLAHRNSPYSTLRPVHRSHANKTTEMVDCATEHNYSLYEGLCGLYLKNTAVSYIYEFEGQVPTSWIA